MDVVTQYLQKSVTFKCPLCIENVSEMDILRKHVTDTHFMSLEVATNLLQLIDRTEPEAVKKNSEKALEKCKPVENLKTAINGTTITTALSTSVTPIDNNETNLDDAIDVLREISGSNSLCYSSVYKDKVFSCAVCSQTFIGVENLVCHHNETGHLTYKNTPKGNCSKDQELLTFHELYLSTSLVEEPDSAPAAKTSSFKNPEDPSNEISAISPFCPPITSSYSEKTSVASKFQTSANFQVTPNSAPSIYPATETPQFQFKAYPDHNNIMPQAINLMQPTSVEPNLSPLSHPIYNFKRSSQETFMQHQQLYCSFAQSSKSQITPNLSQVQQMLQIKKENSFKKQNRLSLGLKVSTPSPTSNNIVTTQICPSLKQQKLMSKYRFIKPKPLTSRRKHKNFGSEVKQFNKDSQARPKKKTIKKYEQKENNNQKQEQKDTEKENKKIDLNETNLSACNKCGKVFLNIWFLRAHQEENHKDIVPIKSVEDKILDLPEINLSVCNKCGTVFLNILFLKAHEEENHKDIVPIKSVEKFTEVFHEDCERRNASISAINDNMAKAPFPPYSGELSTSPSATLVSPSRVGHMSFSNVVTPRVPSLESQALDVASLVIENQQTVAKRQSNQHLQSISMGLKIPLNLRKNKNLPFAESTNAHIPIGPPMMPRPRDAMMPGEALEPHSFAAQQKLLQQQLFQYPKKTITIINDSQFKILRDYFDINNSPTNDQLVDLSEKSEHTSEAFEERETKTNNHEKIEELPKLNNKEIQLKKCTINECLKLNNQLIANKSVILIPLLRKC